MNNNIGHLQNIWQNQNLSTDKINFESLIPKLKAFDKQEKKRSSFKIILLTIAVLFLSGQLLIGIGATQLQLIAVVIIVAASFLTMKTYWHLQNELRGMDLSKPTAMVVDKVIDNIHKQQRFFKVNYFYFVCCLTAAINISFYDFGLQHNEEPSLSLHLAITASILVGAALGRFIRRSIFNKEQKPVLEQLEKFKTEKEN